MSPYLLGSKLCNCLKSIHQVYEEKEEDGADHCIVIEIFLVST